MSDGRVNSGRHKGGYSLTRTDRCPSGELIENARMEKNLSIVDLAYISRLSPNTIAKIERYGVISTRVDTLLSICKALDLDLMTLIKADVGQVL